MTTLNIGRPTGAVEGVGKVTGDAKYAADIVLPGMLWGKCLRSPFPHARILSIDVSKAKKLAGVRAVLVGADLPERLVGRGNIRDMPMMARDQVRFIGERVAVVAAESPDIAEEALGLIEVEYEELPAVFDPLEAMSSQAPRVHDDPASYGSWPLPIVLHGEHNIFPPLPNVVSQVIYRHGDLEAGFARADKVFEHSFRLPPVHHSYIEPHACLVAKDRDGRIDFWLSNKSPFLARGVLSSVLDVPETQIRLNPVFIGGDFGGKGSLMDSVICYYLAQKTGHPVKMVMSYAEELQAANPRHAALVSLRTGVTNDGTMTARQARIVFNSGAYGALRPLHTLHGAGHIGDSYRIANFETEVLCVYTNTVPCGHMRAPGSPQVAFAAESQMDMIAHDLGLNPVEIRLRNALAEGDESPSGKRWKNIRCQDVIRAAAEAIEYKKERPPKTGWGLAIHNWEPGSFGPSSATLIMDAEAQFTLITGASNTGTGSYTILQQIVAEELQVPLTQVRVIQGDTDTAGIEMGPAGSRLTHTAGQATLTTVREFKQMLLETSAKLLNMGPEELTWNGGRIVGRNGENATLNAIARFANERGLLPLRHTAIYVPKGSSETTSFCAQAVEVEVDAETGRVKINKVVTCHDVGTIINPLTHQGQIEGGLIQSLGQALMEELVIEDGAVTNLNLGDYKIPTSADIPQLKTVLLESKDGPAPYQAKGIGELSNVALPAALANAIFDAVGARLSELPITAEKVHSALLSEQ